MNKIRTTPIGEFTAQIEPVLGKKIEAYLGIPYAKAAPFALPGYDLEDGSEFSSVERIASELADDLLEKVIVNAFSSTQYSEEDLKYMQKFVSDTVFKSFEGMDHGDMALFYPERMAQELRSLEP